MKKLHYWTEEERLYLRCHYEGNRESIATLANHFGVSFYAVKGQIQDMGIRHKEKKTWTPEEESLLRKLATKYSKYTIAHRMNRTVNAIEVKANRLGIKRLSRDGWYTMHEVCEICGVDHHKFHYWLENGYIIATKHDKLNAGNNNRWHVSQPVLKKFLRRYPQELVGKNVDIIQIVEILAGIDHNGNGVTE